MTGQKSSRGRPKGSGLDDQKSLRAIAKLMAADPSLKPTTAIKKLGISDPSVIRRLRDKFHSFNLPTEPASAAPSVMRTETLAAAVEGSAHKTEHGATPDWLVTWSGLGLRALTASIEVQIAVIGEALRLPPVTIAFRQHVLFNELALSLYFRDLEASKSLH